MSTLLDNLNCGRMHVPASALYRAAAILSDLDDTKSDYPSRLASHIYNKVQNATPEQRLFLCDDILNGWAEHLAGQSEDPWAYNSQDQDPTYQALQECLSDSNPQNILDARAEIALEVKALRCELGWAEHLLRNFDTVFGTEEG